MIELIMAGMRYGVTAACCVGTFAVCIALLSPIVLLAWILAAKILSAGGNENV